MTSVKIGELYNKYLAKGYSIVDTPTGHELIYPRNLKVRSIGNEFKRVKCLSRHRTSKELVRISFRKSIPITVTTDHICMAYNDDHMLVNMASKELRVGMVVRRYDRESDSEGTDSIVGIDNLGPTDDYVYDLEVEDESHVFYANGTLIHNSYFMNLEAVTKDFIKKYGYGDNLNNWTDGQKLQLWNHIQKFVNEYLVPNVQALVTREFHTSNAAPMRYGLEYMTSGGIFESPKHYIVHKIVDEGPKLVDKFKYTGIELKKAQVPPEVKKFMKDIYFTAVLDPNFDQVAIKNKMDEVYQELLKMPPDALAKWQGYGTETTMEGFLLESKGATGIGKCANYYNQIIRKLHLDKKYALINVGEKIQTIYVRPTNIYGISQIGFPPRQWPSEFNDIFEIDYPTMANKILISPLKGLFNALGMQSLSKYDPSVISSMEYSIDDI